MPTRASKDNVKPGVRSYPDERSARHAIAALKKSGREFEILGPTSVRVGEQLSPVATTIGATVHTAYASRTLMKRADTCRSEKGEIALPCPDHLHCLITDRPGPALPKPSFVDVGREALVIDGRFKNLKGMVQSRGDGVTRLKIALASKELLIDFKDSEIRPASE